MRLNLSDNKVIGLLLVALISQILLLLWHMGLLGLPGAETSQTSGQVAGTIESIEKNLKRRPINSLIWEESRAPEKVYFHDSVLTLSDSTAKIQLQNGTQINLSENTLITIEPEKESSSGEIRIKMAQGNIRARNPFEKAIIEDQSTSVKIDADSDIDLMKDESGQIEILVNKGQADIVFQDKAYAVAKNERMVLNKEGVSKDKVSDSLKWQSSDLFRYYTHSDQTQVSLAWVGSAQKLVVLKDGETYLQISLQPQQSKWMGELPLGTYWVFLKGQEGRTKNRELQIWPAPKIQLVMPRPRDRRKSGALQFVWTPQSSLKSYELVLKTEGQTLRFPANLNKTTETIDLEGDFEWEVWGLDHKGFKIPPAYTYPLFLRDNPFAPPKLNKPKIIKPQPKTSWLERLFIPQARAEQNQTAVFSWQEIPGAEIYFIEISTDKEFRSPVVKEQLTQPVFQWTDFDEKKTYYWRVAAGDRSGRMGVFSEPTVVDWDYVLPKKTEATPTKAKAVKPKPRTQPRTRPVVQRRQVRDRVKPPEKIQSEPRPPRTTRPTETKEDTTPRPYFHSAGLFYMPGFALKNYKADGLTKANLQGGNPISLGVELKFFITRQSLLRLYSKINLLEYEPQPKNAFPFQPNIKTRTWVNHISWSPMDSTWGVGLWISELPTLERQSFEQVRIEQTVAYGILGEKTFSVGAGEWISQAAIINSQDSWGGATSQRFLYPLSWGFHVGAEIELIYLAAEDDGDLLADGYFILGWKF